MCSGKERCSLMTQPTVPRFIFFPWISCLCNYCSRNLKTPVPIMANTPAWSQCWTLEGNLFPYNRLEVRYAHCFGIIISKHDIANPGPHRYSLASDKDAESFTHVLCLFRQNMFQVESVNCICVDWKSGSRTGYTQASQNIRIVGAEVAYFVEVLQVTCVWKPTHMASLGSLPRDNKKRCGCDHY